MTNEQFERSAYVWIKDRSMTLAEFKRRLRLAQNMFGVPTLSRNA